MINVQQLRPKHLSQLVLNQDSIRLPALAGLASALDLASISIIVALIGNASESRVLRVGLCHAIFVGAERPVVVPCYCILF